MGRYNESQITLDKKDFDHRQQIGEMEEEVAQLKSMIVHLREELRKSKQELSDNRANSEINH